MEKSLQLRLDKIYEAVIDDAIKQTYPGLRVRGSIMEVPISDFIAIRKRFGAESSETDLKEAVRNLTSLAEEMGSISRLENQNLPLDMIYQDPYGARVGLAVLTGTCGKESLDGLTNISKSAVVDKLVNLTDKKIPSPYNATVVNVDKSKVIDLLYFNSRYNGRKIGQSENARAEMLAKTLCII